MPFKDPLTADTVLVRGAIQSPNYVPGVSGWIVRQNGSAEFADLTARGTIIANQIRTSEVQTDPRLWINNPAGDPNQILFYKEDQDDTTVLKQLAKIYGSSFAAQNPGLHLEAWGDVGDLDFTGMQVVAGAPGTGVGAIIELTSPDAVSIQSVPDGFRHNGFRVMTSQDTEVGETSASANLTLTTAFQDMPGMSFPFTTDHDGQVQINASFDFLITTAIGAGGLAVGNAVLDGNVLPTAGVARTPYANANAAGRILATGGWTEQIAAGNHTLVFQARKTINAGVAACQSSVSAANILIVQNEA